jgi:hypothetical protein
MELGSPMRIRQKQLSTSLNLRVVGGPRIQPQTRLTARQSLWLHLNLTHGQRFRSLGLDSWPPNNPQIQTRCSRAVFEGSTQGNQAHIIYIETPILGLNNDHFTKIHFFNSLVLLLYSIGIFS